MDRCLDILSESFAFYSFNADTFLKVLQRYVHLNS